VVAGHRSSELQPVIERLDAALLLNERYDEGMFSSVVAGVAGLEKETEAFFLMPADIPLVRRETVSRMMQAYRNGKGGLLYPVFKGRRGHPPLIPARLCHEILSWNEDGGLKALLARHETEAGEVDTDDGNILLDMDTQADYERILAAWRDSFVPTVPECESILARVSAAGSLLIDHSRAVSKLAVFLAMKLNFSGCRLEVGLVEAASLLHDMAKGSANHPAEGARTVAEAGYPDVAAIIAEHMDIIVDEKGPVTAGELVYLAGKMISRNGCVPIEERFAPRLEVHSLGPEVRKTVKLRMRNALLIREKIEKKLGRPLYEILTENGFSQ
jgi:molybdenum cofactor cytidylyltransferase